MASVGDSEFLNLGSNPSVPATLYIPKCHSRSTARTLDSKPNYGGSNPSCGAIFIREAKVDKRRPAKLDLVVANTTPYSTLNATVP